MLERPWLRKLSFSKGPNINNIRKSGKRINLSLSALIMKSRNLIIIIALIVIADQALKIYIKTNFQLNDAQPVMGNWFQLYFVENPGMAYGLKFGGNWGKVALTVFRLIAVGFGDRKSTRLNSSHSTLSRMPSSA